MKFIFESLETRTLLAAQFDVTSITALRADSNYAGVDGSGIGIAIIDTGVFAQHPDLSANFAGYFNAVTTPATANAITVITGASDPEGHGTHVTGTAASSNPEIGVANAAHYIGIHALQSAGESTPSFDPVDNALRWVINHYAQFNIKVVNLSVGVPSVNDNSGLLSDQEALDIRQLESLGITVVSASGNNYASFASPGAEIPAAYSTISVANTWATSTSSSGFPIISGSGGNVSFFAQENDAAPDRFAATSQRSSLPNQVAAPGQDIISTWNDPTKPYQVESGTSMSSPLVAGVVALMQDAAFTYGGRYLLPAEVVSLIRNNADVIIDSNVASNSRIPITYDSFGNPRRSGTNQNLAETGLTFQRVNAYRTIQAVRSLVQTGNPNPAPNPNPTPTADANNTLASAIVVPPLNGTQVFNLTGSIGADGSVSVGASDVDLARVTLASPGFISFALSPTAGGATFDPYARLFNASGAQIAALDNSQTSPYPTLVSPRLAAGTYYLGVSAAGNIAYNPFDGSSAINGASQGDYALAVSLSNPDPNGVVQGASNIDLTAPDLINPHTNLPANFAFGIIDSDPNPLDASAPRIQIGPTDVDFFSFTAPDNGVVTIDVDALASTLPDDGVDSYLRAFDANLNVIAQNDDSEGTDSFLQIQVSAGQLYYLAVTTFGNRGFNPTDPFDRVSVTQQIGRYELYTYFDNGDGNGTVFTAIPQSIGSGGNATIGADGGLTVGVNGGKDVDFYSYTAASDGLFDITAQSTTNGFDPILALWIFNAGNNTITKVRSSSVGNPHLIIAATSGQTYYISVTGNGNNDFNWFAPASGTGGETGNYSIATQLRPSSDLAALTNDSINNGHPTSITLDAPILGNIGVDGGVLVGAADVDLYSFVANFSGALTVRATVPSDSPGDPFLRAFDAAGNKIAANDDAGATTRNAILTITVNAGQTYYFGVNGHSAQSQAYDALTGTGAVAGTQGDYIVTLVPPPTITVANVSVAEGNSPSENSAVFTLTLLSPSTQTITLDYTTGDGFATSDSDYVPAIGALTIPAGQTSATISIPIVGDTTPERDESFVLVLSNSSNALLGNTKASATIVNDDVAAPSTGADLGATSLSIALKGGVALPGDRVNAALVVSNNGAATLAKGKFATNVYISSDATLSPDDVLVATIRKSLQNVKAGQVRTIRSAIKLPAIVKAGTYHFIADVDGANALEEENAIDNVVASAATDIVYRFGNVPGHPGAKVTVLDAGGTPIRFSLAGKGSGSVIVSPSGSLSVTLDNTGAASVAQFQTTGGAIASVLDVTVNGSLKSLLAPTVDLLGALTITGTSRKTVFHNR